MRGGVRSLDLSRFRAGDLSFDLSRFGGGDLSFDPSRLTEAAAAAGGRDEGVGGFCDLSLDLKGNGDRSLLTVGDLSLDLLYRGGEGVLLLNLESLCDGETGREIDDRLLLIGDRDRERLRGGVLDFPLSRSRGGGVLETERLRL